MTALFIRAAFAVALTFCAHPSNAQDLQNYLSKYFTGNAIQFGYGSGISSNSPRVELTIQYCASGIFYSAGRSCRPNIIARGYQCSRLQDSGRWQIVAQGRRAALQWVSNQGNRGGTALMVRRDGVVVDPRGNPFKRIGRAQCR